MAIGLVALLDDIAAFAKLTAASADDIAAGAIKSAAKSAGVVIDDTAVTPAYLAGTKADREIPIIKKITLGSIRNKLLIILPIALILTAIAPKILPILLIFGGLYLAYEGAEKVLTATGIVKSHEERVTNLNEKSVVSGAIRTDLVLSTEIMLIALGNVDTDNWINRALILVLVAFIMTALVYGSVALLIRLDDIGLALAKKYQDFRKNFGLWLVKIMPQIFNIISIIGTVAMLWVAGSILTHNTSELGFDQLLHHPINSFLTFFPSSKILRWFIETGIYALVGLIVGTLVVLIISALKKLIKLLSNK